jgi:hypothetical protein
VTGAAADPDDGRPRSGPTAPGGPSRARLRWRLGAATVLLGLSLVVFRAPVETTVALATAPGADPGRTFGLLVVLVGGALVGPVAAGTLVGDWLYDRRA